MDPTTFRLGTPPDNGRTISPDPYRIVPPGVYPSGHAKRPEDYCNLGAEDCGDADPCLFYDSKDKQPPTPTTIYNDGYGPSTASNSGRDPNSYNSYPGHTRHDHYNAHSVRPHHDPSAQPDPMFYHEDRLSHYSDDPPSPIPHTSEARPHPYTVQDDRSLPFFPLQPRQPLPSLPHFDTSDPSFSLPEGIAKQFGIMKIDGE